jgi:hypothetical protein
MIEPFLWLLAGMALLFGLAGLVFSLKPKQPKQNRFDTYSMRWKQRPYQ